MTELKPGTPLPWITHGGIVAAIKVEPGKPRPFVCDCHNPILGKAAYANAAYIVQACNEYPALLALVGELVGAGQRLAGNAGALMAFEDEIRIVAGHTNVQCLKDAVSAMDATLARAKEMIDGNA